MSFSPVVEPTADDEELLVKNDMDDLISTSSNSDADQKIRVIQRVQFRWRSVQLGSCDGTMMTPRAK